MKIKKTNAATSIAAIKIINIYKILKMKNLVHLSWPA
jgi:hypothetical protein